MKFLMRIFALLVTLLSFLSISPFASAHDLWLVPRMPAGGEFVVEANVGMDFPKSETAPRKSSFAGSFVLLPDGSRGELRMGDVDGNSRLFHFDAKASGVYIAAVTTTPKQITLAADEFNAYLVSDGLAHVFLERTKEKSLDQPGVERYSKSPKALIRVGDGETRGDPCRVVGLPLEIVPLADPFGVKPAGTLGVRVLFQGKPLAEANVGWQSAGDGNSPRGTVRTDAKGEAVVPVARGGLMTLRLTHMTRPKAAEYEWESFWTSLTFEVAK